MLDLGHFAQAGHGAGRDEAYGEAAGIINLSQSFDWVYLRVTLVGITSLSMRHVIVVIEYGRINIGSSPGAHRKGRWISEHGKLEGDLDGLGIIG